MNNTAVLQAHRGVATEYPENTMAAFRAAVMQGYPYIELDPAYTSDCEIVLFHDGTMKRTARKLDGTLPSDNLSVSHLTYAETQEYDVGIWFSEKFRGQKIPKLSEVLEFTSKNGVKVKIDNKIERFPEKVKNVLYEILKKYESHIAITTANIELVSFYEKSFPLAEIHYDGVVSDEILEMLPPLPDRLTVWMPYECQATDWVRVPYADEAFCEKIKKKARLGIWIIKTVSDFEDACARFTPYIVETDGRVKPQNAAERLYDLHTHSKSSHDSTAIVAETAECAHKKGLAGIALTDHLDIQFYIEQRGGEIIKNSISDATCADGLYTDLKVYRGIEVGEGLWDMDTTKRSINENCFDVVLGSVHAVRYKDFTKPYSTIDFSKISDTELFGYLNAYFDDLLETAEKIPCDVLTHMTCPLRYINGKFKRNVDSSYFEEKIERILRAIIDRGIALEINTSYIGFLMPDGWIIKRYIEMGGYLFTLGSDAHVSCDVGRGLDFAAEYLRSLGVRTLYKYSERYGVPYEI